jgi:hypothetical protein
MGYALITQTFTGTGVGTFAPSNSIGVAVFGDFNVTLGGTAPVGTVKLEKSFDGGVNWFDVSRNNAGDPASYALSSSEMAFQMNEPETQVLYRANCTAYTSGTITCRISQ